MSAKRTRGTVYPRVQGHDLIVMCRRRFAECKVWRNPMNLFRGAEYQRFTHATSKEPLTYYDMNLSAQDHQTFFTCEYDAGKQEYESKYSLDTHCVTTHGSPLRV